MSQDIKNLKKKIIYRCSYTGTKETDLLYKKKILTKIDNLRLIELNQLSNLFRVLPDSKILLILTGKVSPPKQFRILFNKLIND